ncbi:hypothetical protein [Sutcliffiella rhizosphaerae]|uniref:Antigen I/II N-terminal domain-containing protein n=1 Tax=Sutcliffiella rhizosphaerae TaxID=2880967 RepID=A0ABM8YKT5_9BACI|nr:hypothetical protein [Sutcliffiella rhizosphaerae]CAG9620353.1 hypothetical protein BACCIP111883_01121 [Sutcliffiella rhizosphaerae]
MSKLWMLMILTGMLVLAGCSSNSEKEVTAEEKEAKDNTEESASVDEGLLDVEVTIPSEMLEEADLDAVVAEVEAEGIEVTKNEDGSLTYKMSKSQHQEMMTEMEQAIKESIEEIKTSGDYVSIKDIKHSNSYNEFTIVVDKAAFEDSMDGFVTIGLGTLGMAYQTYDGVAPDKNKVQLYYEDEETNEVFDEFLFPDGFAE